MRRREFLALVTGPVVFFPGGQARSVDRPRRVAVLVAIGEDAEGRRRAAAFTQGLQELGWKEGENIQTDWRWSAGQSEQLKKDAANIVALQPDVIVAVGTPGLQAIRQALASAPIVFVIVNDPVGQGFVPNLARPGGNMTGFSFFEFPTLGKAMQVLKDLAPAVNRVALLFNPEFTAYYRKYVDSIDATPSSVPLNVTRGEVRSTAEVEQLFARLGSESDWGLVVPPDPFAVQHRSLLIRLAAQHRIPSIYALRQFVKEGGLVSYAPDTADVFRRSASYVDRILNGASPAELPVQSPTKFELVINLITAHQLGLSVPLALQAQADEVIE